MNWVARDAFVDVDQSGFGFTTGDFFAFQSNLVETGDLPTDGILYGRCFLLEDRERNIYCTMSIEFEEGKLFMQGAILDGMNLSGGRGCYEGITGTVQLEIDELGDRFRVFPETARPDNCPDIVEDGVWFESPGDVFVDINRDNFPNTGDIYVFETNALDAGNKEGLVSGECIATPVGDTFCQISYRFEDGTITVQ